MLSVAGRRRTANQRCSGRLASLRAQCKWLPKRAPVAPTSAVTPIPVVRPGQCAVKGCRFSAGASPTRQLVAPAGSNRSGGGGNETVEAFDGKGRLGDSASRQAVTRVNAEQASKRVMRKPTRLTYGEGRRWSSDSERQVSDRSHRGSGDGMRARGDRRNTGSPGGEGA